MYNKLKGIMDAVNENPSDIWDPEQAPDLPSMDTLWNPNNWPTTVGGYPNTNTERPQEPQPDIADSAAKKVADSAAKKVADYVRDTAA